MKAFVHTGDGMGRRLDCTYGLGRSIDVVVWLRSSGDGVGSVPSAPTGDALAGSDEPGKQFDWDGEQQSYYNGGDGGAEALLQWNGDGP